MSNHQVTLLGGVESDVFLNAVSYAAPQITTLAGCSVPFTSPLPGVSQCNRTGLDPISLFGLNFGTTGISVYMLLFDLLLFFFFAISYVVSTFWLHQQECLYLLDPKGAQSQRYLTPGLIAHYHLVEPLITKSS
jgi:hypothetical protein